LISVSLGTVGVTLLTGLPDIATQPRPWEARALIHIRTYATVRYGSTNSFSGKIVDYLHTAPLKPRNEQRSRVGIFLAFNSHPPAVNGLRGEQ